MLTILSPGPTRIVGVVNVGTDSFSTPTRNSIEDAITLGLQLADDGADIIDVGGESTRPGSERTSEEDELAHVIPVVKALSDVGLMVSIDTVRASVAAEAIRSGAVIVNDVSGGLVDPGILDVAAAERVAYILQHWHQPFHHAPVYTSIIDEVTTELAERVGNALAAGVDHERIIVDPGIGFGKSGAQNWELLNHADAIAALGLPVLWGVSRKRFLADVYPEPTQPWQRDLAGVAITAMLARQGVWGVRVHTAVDHRVAINTAWRVRAGGDAGSPPETDQEG